MFLCDLIAYLEAQPQDLVMPAGFKRPHSYRGYYDRLAFEPAENVTIASMLADARSAVDKTFSGYKGGEYTMDALTDTYIAEYGCCGDEISTRLLDYMVRDALALAREGQGGG